jgi:hypothetical protein
VSDEPRRSYTGREIVLEFFPATPDRLVPRSSAYAVTRDEDDGATVRDRVSGRSLLRLAPVERANRRTVRQCCDLCSWSGSSGELRFLRAVVPGSDGRRWRYLIACVDVETCDARRIDDVVLDRLLDGA